VGRLALSTGLSASGGFRMRPAGIIHGLLLTILRASRPVYEYLVSRPLVSGARARLLNTLAFTTNTKANSAYVDHPKQHGRLNLRLCFGRTEGKGIRFARRLLGLFNRPHKALSFCASSRLIFFWVVTVRKAKSEDAVCIPAFFPS